jgi:hypothetical protein
MHTFFKERRGDRGKYCDSSECHAKKIFSRVTLRMRIIGSPALCYTCESGIRSLTPLSGN